MSCQRRPHQPTSVQPPAWFQASLCDLSPSIPCVQTNLLQPPFQPGRCIGPLDTAFDSTAHLHQSAVGSLCPTIRVGRNVPSIIKLIHGVACRQVGRCRNTQVLVYRAQRLLRRGVFRPVICSVAWGGTNRLRAWCRITRRIERSPGIRCGRLRPSRNKRDTLAAAGPCP